jgi:hypothetical protein
LSFTVVLGTSSRIVAASDSRSAAGQRVASDTCRKIDADGRYLSAWTGHQIVGWAWSTTPVVAGEPGDVRAHRVLARLRAIAEREKYPEEGLKPEYHLALALFHCAGGGTITGRYFELVWRTTERRLEVKSTGAIAPGGMGFPFAICVGYDEDASGRPFYDGVSPARRALTVRAFAFLRTMPAESAMVEHARVMVTTAARDVRTPLIGGPTHLALLDAAGARWITPDSPAVPLEACS